MTDATVEGIAHSLGRDHAARFDRRMPGHASRRPATKPEHTVVSNGLVNLVFWISGAGFLVALLILATAKLLGHEIAKGGYSDNTEAQEILVGNDLLLIPSNKIRFEGQRRSGTANRVDLYLHWPSMQGYSENLKHHFMSAAGQKHIIFASIEPRSMPLDMAGRIEPIYSSFYDGPAIDSGDGLIRQPLSPASGYIDEDLVIEKNSPYPFVARCLRNNAKGSKPFCIRDIHLGSDMMVTYRFHADLLPQWLVLDERVRSSLKSLLIR